MDSIIKYRSRRKDIEQVVSKASRSIMLDPSITTKGEACADLPTDFVAVAEGHVAQALAVVQSFADSLGMGDKITVRHDWTWRTFNAKRPRSKGGVFKSFARSMDYSETLPRGAHMVLRLAHIDTHKESYVLQEYERISSHDRIGSVDGLTLQQRLAALVAHEGAHAMVITAQIQGPIHAPQSIRDWMNDVDPVVLRSGSEYNATIESMANKWKGDGNYRIVSNTEDQIWGAHEAAWQSVYAEIRSRMGLVAQSGKSATIRKVEPDLIENTCEHCGVIFQTKKPAKTCSSKCRMAASRARQSAQAEEP